MTKTTFASLPLAAPLHRALAERDYHTPSPIQAQSIPLLLEGRDLLGCAQTGTGKTAAFSLPILHALHTDPRPAQAKSPRALVLAPTRELAQQVGKSFSDYGAHVRFRQALVYGGVSQHSQVKALRSGVDVLVACPGRLLDLVNQGHVDLSHVEFLVLDEVDRMLDMGFIHDVKKIVSLLPRKRQSLFFSATLAPPIVTLANTILRDPAEVSIEPETTTAANVDHRVCFLPAEEKRRLLQHFLLEQGEGELTIVFSRTKYGADKLARFLNNEGIQAEAIHGNRSQSQRERTLKRFRDGRVPVLVATDVAARGVDVRAVSLVINFDLPEEPEAYVHRIGRTGRAGDRGRALSFCSADQRGLLVEIEKIVRFSIPVEEAHPWHDAGLANRHAAKPEPRPAQARNRRSRGRPRRSRQRRAA